MNANDNSPPLEQPGDGFSVQYWKDLVQYAQIVRGEPPLGDFGKLQIINITHLLNQLARIKAEIEHSQTFNTGQMSLLQQILHQYGQSLHRASKGASLSGNAADAIRDYKLITELDNLPHYANDKRISLEGAFPDLARPYLGEKNRPYDTVYRTVRRKTAQSQDPIRNILRKSLPSRLSWTDPERSVKRLQYGAGEKPEIYSRFLDSVARFIIGTLGGCALIVPMLLMVLHPSLIKSLIVVSVAVVLFALIVGLVFETDNKDTITATATYAAVLVVFVGTSGSGSGSGN